MAALSPCPWPQQGSANVPFDLAGWSQCFIGAIRLVAIFHWPQQCSDNVSVALSHDPSRVVPMVPFPEQGNGNVFSELQKEQIWLGTLKGRGVRGGVGQKS